MTQNDKKEETLPTIMHSAGLRVHMEYTDKNPGLIWIEKSEDVMEYLKEIEYLSKYWTTGHKTLEDLIKSLESVISGKSMMPPWNRLCADDAKCAMQCVKELIRDLVSGMESVFWVNDDIIAETARINTLRTMAYTVETMGLPIQINTNIQRYLNNYPCSSPTSAFGTPSTVVSPSTIRSPSATYSSFTSPSASSSASSNFISPSSSQSSSNELFISPDTPEPFIHTPTFIMPKHESPRIQIPSSPYLHMVAVDLSVADLTSGYSSVSTSPRNTSPRLKIQELLVATEQTPQKNDLISPIHDDSSLDENDEFFV